MTAVNIQFWISL